MVGFFYILVAISIIFLTYLFFQAIGGKIFGAKIQEIGIFVKPNLVKIRLGKINSSLNSVSNDELAKIGRFASLGDIDFSLNAIPLGCFVKFTDDFQYLHPFRKILIVFCGLLGYLTIALICIGTETFSQIFSGFGQYLGGAISPIQVGTKLISSAANIFEERSFLTGLGIISSKFLVANLFPLGTLAGGQIIIYLLQLLGFKSENFAERYNLISFFIILPLTISWLIAIAVFIWRSYGN